MLPAVDALVIGVLGAAIGVVGGFLVARHVDRLGARRLAYRGYVGAIEVAGATLRTRLLDIRDHPDRRPFPPLADAQPVNDTLGEMWTVAPADMMRIVERMQNHLRAMELAAVPSRTDSDTITAAIKAFDDLREELVNKARAQTGEGRLPASAFRDY